MNMFFGSSGSPLVNLLIGLIILAGIAVMLTVMLPVALVILLVIIFLGVLNAIWFKVTGKALFGDVWQKYQSKWQTYRNEEGVYQETQEEYTRKTQSGRTESYSASQVLRITTSDNKKWKMRDVEDLETKDK